MKITCKNYDFMFIMNFVAGWFGRQTRVSEISREEIAGVLKEFFGG